MAKVNSTRIAARLRAVYDACDRRPLDAATARIAIVSDMHRGQGDGADDFKRSKSAYHAALDHYMAGGYTVCLLGDVEELWECSPRPVLAKYADTVALEAALHRAGRLLRLFGNHDDMWSRGSKVRELLDPLHRDGGAAPLVVREGLRFDVAEDGAPLGTLFLAHGHQGTSDSEKYAVVSRLFVRYVWRPLQRLTKWRLNTPATDFELRAEHDRAMYAWAATMDNMALIVGHTHRPVFAARNHEESKAPVDGTRPCYFNTGCCCFDDGDITAIEIVGGEIRLVRWPDDDGNPAPKVLRRRALAAVMGDLAPASARASVGGGEGVVL